MHLRVSRKERDNRVYEYAQIVQSYRRPDGMPAHKVIGNLGRLSPLAIENLKIALEASRRGQAVLLNEDRTTAAPRFKVKQNLAYLDIQLALHLWSEWALCDLIGQCIPPSVPGPDVPWGDIIAALVLQRCVAPDSKLAATRWFPTTALPELLGISGGQFNNSRIHRALTALESGETAIQDRIVQRLVDSKGGFTRLYLDCTDTWFEGIGPDLAQKRTTKNGMLRRRIGIALLCEQQGYPLRWKTLPGSHDESKTMTEILRRLKEVPWAKEVPIIVDRAMGRGVTVETLRAFDLHFVTAVPVHEISTYSPYEPWWPIEIPAEAQTPGADDPGDKALVRVLGEAAERAGFEAIDKGRYVLDLGIVNAKPSKGRLAPEVGPSRAVASLELAHRLRAELDSSRITQKELAKKLGCTTRMMRRWLNLLYLIPEIQDRIRDREADRLTPEDLERIARLAPDKQCEAFGQRIHAGGAGYPLRPSRKLRELAGIRPPDVRAVLLFNPERFLERRRTALERVEKMGEFLADLNRRLATPQSRRDDKSVYGEVAEYLRKHSLLKLYEIQIGTIGRGAEAHYRASVMRDEQEWQRRRRADGYMLVVTHPKVRLSAGQIVEVYFAKDKIEKDFQVIKSVLELRPIYHRRDPKVRAHVTLCVLALFLERDLEYRLRSAAAPQTAASVFEVLKTCHLNRIAEEAPIYTVTEAGPEQVRILRALGLERLATDEYAIESMRGG